MLVKFIEVGRNKLTWVAKCNGVLTDKWLYFQARAALMSRDIEFGETGEIYAGMRNVGRFEIIEGEITNG